MACTATANRSNFCQNKMRQNYYRSGHIYQKSGRLLQIGAQNTYIVVGPFLLKLNTITMNFEINIFYNILKDNVHGQVHSQKYQRLLPEQESITDVSLGTDLYGQSRLQKFQKTVSGGIFCQLKHRIRISQQPKNLLYPITDAFTREFGTAKRMWLSFLWIRLHDYSLQPTTEPKTSLHLTFLEVFRNLCKTIPFSLTLQTCRPEFLISTKMLIL